jgi:hypothetical protein
MQTPTSHGVENIRTRFSRFRELGNRLTGGGLRALLKRLLIRVRHWGDQSVSPLQADGSPVPSSADATLERVEPPRSFAQTFHISERIAALRHKPWYSVDLPAEVAKITKAAMIHPDERRMLYTLARDYFLGAGRIIDGGTYLGASSLSLGYGLKDRGYQKEPIIDAFDRFTIDELSLQYYFDQEPEPARQIKAGDNIRFLYERNIATIADYVTIHDGDLAQTPWSGEAIEILFSDISKGWSLNDYIISNWISALLPEIGILIQQDQVQEYHVWVAITMEILADYFEIIDYTMYSSMVYRLKREIPARVLQKCLSANILPAEMEYYYLSFLERFRRVGMGRYRGWNLGMVEAGLVVTYGFYIGDTAKAWHVLRACEDKFHGVPDTMTRLAGIKKQLEAGSLAPAPSLYG